MKKISVIFTILVGLFLVNTVYAASASVIYFSPSVKTVNVGSVFNIKVLVDPKGTALDTVRAAVSFPADKLEATYFSLGSLYPNSSPGNFIDNKRGLIYEGGAIFGGNTLLNGTFGIITFKAKSAGLATISLSNRSRLILAGEEKINLANSGSVNITINNNKVEEPTGETAPQKQVVAGQVLVNSISHLDQAQWYNHNNVELNWQMSETSSPALSYLYNFNQDPESNPDKVITTTSKTFDLVDDGVWYFHIKAKLSNKIFTDVVTHKVMLDASAPNKLMVVLENNDIVENEITKVHFATIDSISGVAFYDLAVDGGAFSQQSSPYVLEGLKAGDHTIIVRALDQAGNVTSDAAKLTVRHQVKVAWEVALKMFWQNYYYLILGGLSILLLLLLLIIKKIK